MGLFWCVFSNAWLAILAYHAQILFWWSRAPRNARGPDERKTLFLAFPFALAGPLLYFLLPVITRTPLASWLSTYHLSGLSLVILIPYFGLVHPVIEQIHWHQLREETVWAHPMFAGYHMIVLSSLLSLPWLLLCFVVLFLASLCWKYMAQITKGLVVPTISHILADLGIVVAAWARVH